MVAIGVLGEDAAALRARHLEPMVDVGVRLGLGERRQVKAQAHALRELHQLRAN